MPPYEVTRIMRTAGFEPLAPPLREGTTYVMRATDFRGILMRVVVDAHSGAIRAVNRIVSDQGMYGAVDMLPPPYGAPPAYSGPAAAAYAPPEFDVPDIAPREEASAPPLRLPPLSVPSHILWSSNRRCRVRAPRLLPRANLRRRQARRQTLRYASAHHRAIAKQTLADRAS